MAAADVCLVLGIHALVDVLSVQNVVAAISRARTPGHNTTVQRRYQHQHIVRLSQQQLRRVQEKHRADTSTMDVTDSESESDEIPHFFQNPKSNGY